MCIPGSADMLHSFTRQLSKQACFRVRSSGDRFGAIAWLRGLFALLVLTLLGTGGYAQHGARTLPLGLDQLTQEADVIVRGYVISTKFEPHPQLSNLTTVVVSMSVTETVKGTPRKSLVFRQYVWDVHDQLDTAEYRKGDELLLLLAPVSQYGLTSPVGLEQGRFQILRDKKGQAVAVNGRGNFGLFDSVERRAQAQGMQLSPRVTSLVRRTNSGPMPLSDLEDAIRAFKESR